MGKLIIQREIITNDKDLQKTKTQPYFINLKRMRPLFFNTLVLAYPKAEPHEGKALIVGLLDVDASNRLLFTSVPRLL